MEMEMNARGTHIGPSWIAHERGHLQSLSNTWTSFVGVLAWLAWVPRRSRDTPDHQFHFNLALNLLFGLASTITAANLYYSYPVLNKIADHFNISYERASLIQTLSQAGYGSGILFLCPLGDRHRLRPFVLGLVLWTATMWIVLCTTESFTVFCAFSFVTGFTTVTPQLMIPLVSALAPPTRRASAISIVFSGLMFGMLLPRTLSGVVTEYTGWRSIYWAALGIQYLIFGLLWIFMPDYPSIDSDRLGYFGMLWSIILLITKQPILTYGCMMVFFSNAVFASFWTTLTAILSGPPYDYSSLSIGLFALIGIAPLILIPPYSRVVIDRFVPTFSVGLGLTCALAGVLIGTYTGSFTIAGLVIQAIVVDFGIQSASVAYRAAIYATAPQARNRTNVAYTVSAFIGQLMGTSTGNHLYSIGGWVRSGELNIGFIGAALAVSCLRGPWETQWVGWRGGFSMRRKDLLGESSYVEE